jgi:hypothetical protein
MRIEALVYVHDKQGNAYICDIDDLREPSRVSDKEKTTCTDLDHGQFTRND